MSRVTDTAQGGLRLLAIETSSQTGTVALAVGAAVAERTIASPREQTATVLALVNELLADAGCTLSSLDALVFGRGPGSFTGLRVAAAVAQGLSLASGRPIVAVSSLAGLAQRGLGARLQEPAGDARDSAACSVPVAVQAAIAAREFAERALCCVDARMGEVYTGLYRLEDGLAVADAAESIVRPEQVAKPDGDFVALGDGWAAHADALAAVAAEAGERVATLVPRARDLLPLASADVNAGRFAPLEAALPVYLRDADAWQRA